MLLEKAIMMLLAFSRADAVVKSYICTRDCMQQLMDSLGKLQQPHLTRVGDATRRKRLQQHARCCCACTCAGAGGCCSAPCCDVNACSGIDSSYATAMHWLSLPGLLRNTTIASPSPHFC